MASDFTRGAPFSAYWQYVEGQFRNICGTQGASFLRRLRAVLGISTIGPWDDSVQSRLIESVNNIRQQDPDPGWQTVLLDLQQAAVDRRVNPTSLQLAIWLTYYQSNGRRFDSIIFFADTVPPQWGVLPANDNGYNGGRILCYDPRLDQDFVTTVDVARATANSVTGVRLEEGRAAPQSDTRLVQSGESTVSPLTVLVVSGLLVAVAAAVFMPQQQRRNSARRKKGNPLNGLSAESQYEKVQWGNKPKKETDVDVKHLQRKQKMVLMGRFRMLRIKTADGSLKEIKARKPYPYLAFGAEDNKLWIVGGSLPEMARNHDFGPPGQSASIVRTDYESTKGEKDGKKYYYYHDHKTPFAKLRVHADGYPEFLGGGYSVRPEGIVR